MSDDAAEYRYGAIYCTVCGNRSARRFRSPDDQTGETIPELVLGMTEAQAADVRLGRCVYCGGAMDVRWRVDIEPPPE